MSNRKSSACIELLYLSRWILTLFTALFGRTSLYVRLVKKNVLDKENFPLNANVSHSEKKYWHCVCAVVRCVKNSKELQNVPHLYTKILPDGRLGEGKKQTNDKKLHFRRWRWNETNTFRFSLLLRARPHDNHTSVMGLRRHKLHFATKSIQSRQIPDF